MNKRLPSNLYYRLLGDSTREAARFVVESVRNAQINGSGVTVLHPGDTFGLLVDHLWSSDRLKLSDVVGDYIAEVTRHVPGAADWLTRTDLIHGLMYALPSNNEEASEIESWLVDNATA